MPSGQKLTIIHPRMLVLNRLLIDSYKNRTVSNSIHQDLEKKEFFKISDLNLIRVRNHLKNLKQQPDPLVLKVDGQVYVSDKGKNLYKLGILFYTATLNALQISDLGIDADKLKSVFTSVEDYWINNEWQTACEERLDILRTYSLATSHLTIAAICKNHPDWNIFSEHFRIRFEDIYSSLTTDKYPTNQRRDMDGSFENAASLFEKKSLIADGKPTGEFKIQLAALHKFIELERSRLFES